MRLSHFSNLFSIWITHSDYLRSTRSIPKYQRSTFRRFCKNLFSTNTFTRSGGSTRHTSVCFRVAEYRFFRVWILYTSTFEIWVGKIEWWRSVVWCLFFRLFVSFAVSKGEFLNVDWVFRKFPCDYGNRFDLSFVLLLICVFFVWLA